MSRKIIIGYEDRMLGDLEIPATKFTPINHGGDLPYHRITYFRHQNQEIIWDRNRRIDVLYHSGETKKLLAENKLNDGEGETRERIERAEKAKIAQVEQSDNIPHDEKISKFLASVLRHKAIEFGQVIRDDGYVELDEIMKIPNLTNMGVTLEDIERVVLNSNKQRFSIATLKGDGRRFIRANQGHSIATVKAEKLLDKVGSWQELDGCYHGTYNRFLQSIKEQGLKSMQRNHMHFALPDKDGNITSGMREDCEVKLYLDVEKCFTAGMTFYRSKNGVILTSGNDEGRIPYHLFKTEEKN